jgi:hypothetical protein
MGRRDESITGWVGVLGVTSGIVGGVIVAPIWGFPGTASSQARIVGFVSDHRTALLVGMLFNTVAVLLWLAFAAGVWSYLRRVAGGDTPELACFGFGAASLVTLLLAGFTAFFALVYRAGPPSEARTLYDLTFGLLAMSAAPTALALAAFAAVVRRSGCLPAATAVLALVAAVAHIALFASFVVRHGFFSLEGQVITAIPATLFLWIAATGAAMVRAPRAEVAR